MTRQEILDKINSIIEEEHGEPVKEDSLLTDCNIDSFGYAMLWLGMENDIVKHDPDIKIFDKDYAKDIDYKTLKVSTIIDRIEEFARCI